ncbi:hypothetical protein LIA77_10163 [Sarocladium implicatum]|nr:hypothetical protein LIA77_10163 [Sarocladium implicatum]
MFLVPLQLLPFPFPTEAILFARVNATATNTYYHHHLFAPPNIPARESPYSTPRYGASWGVLSHCSI